MRNVNEALMIGEGQRRSSDLVNFNANGAKYN